MYVPQLLHTACSVEKAEGNGTVMFMNALKRLFEPNDETVASESGQHPSSDTAQSPWQNIDPWSGMGSSLPDANREERTETDRSGSASRTMRRQIRSLFRRKQPSQFSRPRPMSPQQRFPGPNPYGQPATRQHPYRMAQPVPRNQMQMMQRVPQQRPMAGFRQQRTVPIGLPRRVPVQNPRQPLRPWY